MALEHKIGSEETKQAKEVYNVDCKLTKPTKYKLIILSDPQFIFWLQLLNESNNKCYNTKLFLIKGTYLCYQERNKVEIQIIMY